MWFRCHLLIQCAEDDVILNDLLAKEADEFWNLCQHFKTNPKAFYKKRALYLKEIFSSQLTSFGVQYIDCNCTVLEIIQKCIKKNEFMFKNHNEIHEETCVATASLKYNFLAKIIEEPNLCNCGKEITQTSKYLFVDTLFFLIKKKTTLLT